MKWTVRARGTGDDWTLNRLSDRGIPCRAGRTRSHILSSGVNLRTARSCLRSAAVRHAIEEIGASG